MSNTEIAQTQTCDDCQHPYAWHYTCYSGEMDGCSFGGCTCAGFFAYIDDGSDDDA